jgi:hypothetical protein
MSKPSTHKWNGKTILSQDHIPDLEHDAAINEFEHGMPREDAEAEAYRTYRTKYHTEAAAHHLRGLRAAQASGDLDEAQKHGTVYALHLGELGHDPMDAVPASVKALVDGEDRKPQYKYKTHKADQLLVE